MELFVNDNFDPLPHDDNPQGSEFEDWEPNDWNEEIALFNSIKVMEFNGGGGG